MVWWLDRRGSGQVLEDANAEGLSRLRHYLPLLNPQPRQPLHNLHRLQTHANDLPYQLNNILRLIWPVRVVDDAAAFVCLDPILVDDPLQGGAVAEAVGEGLGGDPVQCEEFVVTDLRFVFGQAHLLHAPIERVIRGFDGGKGPSSLSFLAWSVALDLRTCAEKLHVPRPHLHRGARVAIPVGPRTRFSHLTDNQNALPLR